jgi:hypothetical protein
MESFKRSNSAGTLQLLERARAGEQAALNEIFTLHRERLDRRLQARIGAPPAASSWEGL